MATDSNPCYRALVVDYVVTTPRELTEAIALHQEVNATVQHAVYVPEKQLLILEDGRVNRGSYAVGRYKGLLAELKEISGEAVQPRTVELPRAAITQIRRNRRELSHFL